MTSAGLVKLVLTVRLLLLLAIVSFGVILTVIFDQRVGQVSLIVAGHRFVVSGILTVISPFRFFLFVRQKGEISPNTADNKAMASNDISD